MPPAKKRPRRYDPAKTRTAVLAQLGQVRAAVRDLDSERLSRPAPSGAGTVRDLIAHVTASVTVLLDAAERPAPLRQTLQPAEWLLLAAGVPVAPDPDPGERLAEAEDRLRALLDAHPDGRLVETGAGALPLDDFLVTLAVELVARGHDLDAALPGLGIPGDRQALAAASRVLADALALKAPGGSTEVRVPPYAVVQCVAGPRHTRGTPPSVVETDPLTWVLLATGRLSWADAVAEARVSASGERADLSALLPLKA